MVLSRLVGLGLAGALGTLVRYGLAGAVQRFGGAAFPWGTFAVNVTGCFLAGLLWGLCESRWTVTGDMRAVLFVGFMGAFTTFSSVMLETGELLRSSQWFYAVANMTLEIGLGLLSLLMGTKLAWAL